MKIIGKEIIIQVILNAKDNIIKTNKLIKYFVLYLSQTR